MNNLHKLVFLSTPIYGFRPVAVQSNWLGSYQNSAPSRSKSENVKNSLVKSSNRQKIQIMPFKKKPGDTNDNFYEFENSQVYSNDHYNDFLAEMEEDFEEAFDILEENKQIYKKFNRKNDNMIRARTMEIFEDLEEEFENFGLENGNSGESELSELRNSLAQALSDWEDPIGTDSDSSIPAYSGDFENWDLKGEKAFHKLLTINEEAVSHEEILGHLRRLKQIARLIAYHIGSFRRVSRLFAYGCWCLPRGGGLFQTGRGLPVDAIDEKCWNMARCEECLQLDFGLSCDPTDIGYSFEGIGGAGNKNSTIKARKNNISTKIIFMKQTIFVVFFL